MLRSTDLWHAIAPTTMPGNRPLVLAALGARLQIRLGARDVPIGVFVGGVG
jgi:hypothetical protein